MSTLSPEKLNSTSHSIPIDDDIDMTWHDPPSSPFISHIEHDDQENVAPASTVAPTPVKPLLDFDDDDAPQSAFKVSPEKKFGSKDRTSPAKTSPAKQLHDNFEDASFKTSTGSQVSPEKSSPVKQMGMERSESAMSKRSRNSQSPSKSSRNASVESIQRQPELALDRKPEILPTSVKRPSSSHKESILRENEGLTVAMRIMEETRSESHEISTTYHTSNVIADIDTAIEDTDFNPDGPELSSLDVDDTCFSTFSEMPGVDMTKFAFMRKSPTKNGIIDQVSAC